MTSNMKKPKTLPINFTSLFLAFDKSEHLKNSHLDMSVYIDKIKGVNWSVLGGELVGTWGRND